MEVEVREDAEPPPDTTALLVNNTPTYPVTDPPVVIVRAEEVLLVVLVLMIWVAAIALFFNRWGKIRMLEPYQPKFQQAHRPSCPLAPLSPPGITPQQRMSFSKYNVNCFSDTYPTIPSPNAIRRPRQNSVFVGTSTMAFLSPPRRVKSAIDIQHMVVNETRPSIAAFNSMLPIVPHSNRRPSITIDRPPASILPSTSRHHRPSISVDRPYLSHYQQFRSRRPSCFLERSVQRHRNFISFEHPKSKPLCVEKTSFSFQQPTINFEPEDGGRRKSVATGAVPKMSKSFEQPSSRGFEKPSPAPRLSVSLDVDSISFDRRSSIAEEEAPITIILDDTQITAPLLESLKSSDV